MSQINTELGRGATTGISLVETAVRDLAGKPSGAISMSDLHGKSSWTATHTLYPRYAVAFPGTGTERNVWAFAVAGELITTQLGDLSPRTLTARSSVVTMNKIEASLNAGGTKTVRFSQAIAPYESGVTFWVSTTHH